MAPNTPTNLSIIDPTFDVRGVSNKTAILSLSQTQLSSIQQEYEIASESPNVTHVEPEYRIYQSKCVCLCSNVD